MPPRGPRTRPPVTRIHLAVLLVGVVLGPVGGLASASASASASTAPADGTAVARDRAHDVRIFRRSRGLTLAERTSIDLRRVDIRAGAQSVRFTVRLARVVGTRAFDQMVFVSLTPSGDGTAVGSADIGFSPQRRGLSYAAHDVDGLGGYVSCDPLQARVSRRSARVRLDVPVDCVPRGALTVRVTSLTGSFRSDAARPWSRDRLRFPTAVRILDAP